jgi:hypothetical protein
MAGIGIAKKGLGLLGKKKTLTVDKGALRISEINKKLKKTPRRHQQDVFESHIDEVKAIYDKKDKKHIFKDYK